jgi:hypothetical protein
MRTLVLILGGLSVVLVARWVCRCRHEPALKEKRDESGRVVKPHALEWYCGKCLVYLGETSLPVQWQTQRRLRIQAKLRKSA